MAQHSGSRRRRYQTSCARDLDDNLELHACAPAVLLLAGVLLDELEASTHESTQDIRGLCFVGGIPFRFGTPPPDPAVRARIT